MAFPQSITNSPCGWPVLLERSHLFALAEKTGGRFCFSRLVSEEGLKFVTCLLSAIKNAGN